MARRTGRMSDEDLSNVIDGQIADALNYSGSERALHRRNALEYMDGKVPELPAIDGRSTVVSRDVADLHGLIMPSLLRVFFSSDRVAIYEPTKPIWRKVEELDKQTGQPRTVRKDVSEEMAENATAYVNYVVMKECGGYRFFRDAFSDAVLIGNGILKHWWDATPEYVTESFAGLTDDQYRVLFDDGDVVEEVEHSSKVPPDAPDELKAVIEQVGGIEAAIAASLPVPLVHDVKVKKIKSRGRLRAAAVPDEEFLIDKSAKVLDETVRFCAHVSRVTRSDLIKEGFAKKKVDEIPSWSGGETEDARKERDELYEDVDNPPDRSTEYIERYECYVLIDYDGDGIAERRRIIAAGGTGKRNILSNEEWGDDLPFSDIVPDPRAHTWRGKGLFDDASDIQQVKTVALRGILDNVYQILNPQQIVYQSGISPTSMPEVVNPTFGGLILATQQLQPGAPVVMPVERQYIAPQIAPVLDYMDKVTRRRTGISEESMALDMDKMQNQTATAMAVAADQATSKTEEYARNIASFGGLKRFFSCCLKLFTKHQTWTRSIPMRGGTFAEMDPREWDSAMNVSINVGLGTGTRDRDIAALMGIRNAQKEYIAFFGPFNPYCNIAHLADTDRKLAEASGLSNPDGYFPNISQDDVAMIRQQMESRPPPPDPKVEEAKARLQIEQAKAEAGMQMKQMEAQSDQALSQQKLAADLEAQRQKQELEFAATREKNAMELQAMRERSALELQLKREESAAMIELKREEMAIEAMLTREANRQNAAIAQRQADTNIQSPGM